MRRVTYILLLLTWTSTSFAYIPGAETDSVANMLQSANNDTNKVKIYLELEGQFYLSEPNRALRYNRLAIKLAEQLDYKVGMAKAYNNIGLIYYNKGELPKALDHHQRSLEIYAELGKIKRVATVNNNIGRIYVIKKEFGRALEYFQLSMEQSKKLNNNKSVAFSLIGIGVIYKEIGEEGNNAEEVEKNYALALEKYDEALEIVMKLKLKESEAIIYNNVAGIYIKRRKYKVALDEYTKCLKIRIELNDRKGEALTYHNMAEALQGLNQQHDAIEYLGKSIKLARKSEYNLVISSAFQMLSEIYYEQKNFKKAFNYRLQYTSLKDSIFSEDKSQEMGKIEAKYKFEKAEKEEERYVEEQKKRMLESEHRRNNLQYSGILIFIVMIFTGIFFLGKFSIPIKLAEGMIFFAFLLFFEFTLVLLDPYIDTFSRGEPALKLLFNAVLAGLIFPLHSFFEKRLKSRIIKKEGWI